MLGRTLVGAGVVVSSVIGLSGAPAAFACSCAEMPIAAEFDSASEVFVGKVEASRGFGEKDTYNYYKRYTVKVQKTYKGSEGKRQYVRGTPDDGANCGRSLAVGHTYVIWSWQDEAGKSWVNACDRTTESNNAFGRAQIEWLEDHTR